MRVVFFLSRHSCRISRLDGFVSVVDSPWNVPMFQSDLVDFAFFTNFVDEVDVRMLVLTARTIDAVEVRDFHR